ncbi:hypothetical protein [Catenuloplanes atrovinosus]|uniref:Uncharacterized protein n=1 Tax=Catenuloplanes atrovinosus TaxID=137266 RepID=A0AAE3YQ62_9ACTN|nr:hypothetical protein [Catenuloplanes atrovinosus]MDR7276309.1 hypothetical protein [Catenuloplanes atrovinosus]
MRKKILTAAVALAATTGLLGAAAPATADRKPDEPSLTGSAQLFRLDGQDVRFTFDVRGFAMDAQGTFRFTHRHGEQYGWADLKADCLITGGPVATVTGIVTATNVPGLMGQRKGVSVYDHGRHDRLGYSWPISHDIHVEQCLSMAPFETVRTGDFRVEHWFPPLPR